MLLTRETDATRALATAFQRTPALAVTWLSQIGVPCVQVTDVRLETRHGDRRTDIDFDVRTRDGEPAIVTVEAKLDAPVDADQLTAAQREARYVVSLVPEGISPLVPRGVKPANWEDVLKVLRTAKGRDKVSAFLADELAELLNSPAITRRRRLAELVPSALPKEWYVGVTESTAGGALLTLCGPGHSSGHYVSVEFSERARGKSTPLRAQILACSAKSAADPAVWKALESAAGASPGPPRGVHYSGRGGRRTWDEANAARSAGVPLSWTYGYGTKQLENWGWAGFGPRLELEEDSDPSILVAQAVTVAVNIDSRLPD